MSFSEKLQEIRQNNQLSQENLAELLGVTRQSVSKWERGQGYPEIDKLLFMSHYFNISLDEMLKENNASEQTRRPISLHKESDPSENTYQSMREVMPQTVQEIYPNAPQQIQPTPPPYNFRNAAPTNNQTVRHKRKRIKQSQGALCIVAFVTIMTVVSSICIHKSYTNDDVEMYPAVTVAAEDYLPYNADVSCLRSVDDSVRYICPNWCFDEQLNATDVFIEMYNIQTGEKNLLSCTFINDDIVNYYVDADGNRYCTCMDVLMSYIDANEYDEYVLVHDEESGEAFFLSHEYVKPFEAPVINEPVEGGE